MERETREVVLVGVSILIGAVMSSLIGNLLGAGGEVIGFFVIAGLFFGAYAGFAASSLSGMFEI